MTTAVIERPHGYARYKLDGCRCNTCRRAVSQYNRKHAMAVTAGTWCAYVDAEPARQHVKAAKAAGIGWRRIADVTGVARSTIKHLLYGRVGRAPSQRIRPQVAAMLLSFQIDGSVLAAGANVDATGTRRRIQALACLGWTLTSQAEHIGWKVSNYTSLLGRGQVMKATADKVLALYEELSMKRAPAGLGSTRVRNLARARGWKPPLAWDDETIDDPAAKPIGAVKR